MTRKERIERVSEAGKAGDLKEIQRVIDDVPPTVGGGCAEDQELEQRRREAFGEPGDLQSVQREREGE